LALALGVGGAIVLLRLPLSAAVGKDAPFLLAWPGIIVAAFLGGFWPAFLVTGLGLAVGLEVAPFRSPGGVTTASAINYTIFGLVFAAAGGIWSRRVRHERAAAAGLSNMQAQMLHVARLNAMGEMAGTLAHELNQPLTAVTNYVSAARRLLAREASADPRLDEILAKASDQAVRAGQIISRVRDFLKRGEIQQTVESLSNLIEEAVDLTVSARGARPASLHYDFDREADRVLADRIQVQQVVMNLIRNALEAMAASEPRRLSIATRASEEGMVEVCVSDTGPGLSREVQERLFQPFVTSKADGMGVGLAISRNIIESHGGKLWAGSDAGRGARFYFTLKRADRDQADGV
jgi:two-component system sensor kinase FixL